MIMLRLTNLSATTLTIKNNCVKKKRIQKNSTML